MNVKKFNRIVKSPVQWNELYFEVTNTLRNPDYRTKDFIRNILNFTGKIMLASKDQCPTNMSCENMLKAIAISFAKEYGFFDLLPEVKKILLDPTISESLKNVANEYVASA